MHHEWHEFIVIHIIFTSHWYVHTHNFMMAFNWLQKFILLHIIFPPHHVHTHSTYQIGIFVYFKSCPEILTTVNFSAHTTSEKWVLMSLYCKLRLFSMRQWSFSKCFFACCCSKIMIQYTIIVLNATIKHFIIYLPVQWSECSTSDCSSNDVEGSESQQS